MQNCTLGLDCAQMGKDTKGCCANEEICHSYTDAWNLYEIVLLKGLPGAIYLCWHSPDANIEWADEQWGFTYLNSSDWLLHYTAPQNSFENWQHAYYKLSSRNNSKYVRTSLANEFNHLRKRVDKTWRSQENDTRKLFISN